MQPGDDVGPNRRVCLPPNKYCEVLETDTDLAWILDEAGVDPWHGIDAGHDRSRGGDGVGGIDARKHGKSERRRSDDLIPDLKSSGAKVVFAIEPLKGLVNQPSGKGKLVQRPALDPSMERQCPGVADAQGGID